MRDRTIVLAFVGFLVIVGLLVTDSIVGVLAAIVALFVMGIMWVLTQSKVKQETDREAET